MKQYGLEVTSILILVAALGCSEASEPSEVTQSRQTKSSVAQVSGAPDGWMSNHCEERFSESQVMRLLSVSHELVIVDDYEPGAPEPYTEKNENGTLSTLVLPVTYRRGRGLDGAQKAQQTPVRAPIDGSRRYQATDGRVYAETPCQAEAMGLAGRIKNGRGSSAALFVQAQSEGVWVREVFAHSAGSIELPGGWLTAQELAEYVADERRIADPRDRAAMTVGDSDGPPVDEAGAFVPADDGLESPRVRGRTSPALR